MVDETTKISLKRLKYVDFPESPNAERYRASIGFFTRDVSIPALFTDAEGDVYQAERAVPVNHKNPMMLSLMLGDNKSVTESYDVIDGVVSKDYEIRLENNDIQMELPPKIDGIVLGNKASDLGKFERVLVLNKESDWLFTFKKDV